MSMAPIAADRTPDAAASILTRIAALVADRDEWQESGFELVHVDQWSMSEREFDRAFLRITNRIASIDRSITRLTALYELTQES